MYMCRGMWIYRCLKSIFNLLLFLFLCRGTHFSVKFLSQKDKERLKEVKQATDLKAPLSSGPGPQPSTSGSRPSPRLQMSGLLLVAHGISGGAAYEPSNFKPLAKDPAKQKRYERFLVNMKQGSERWVLGRGLPHVTRGCFYCSDPRPRFRASILLWQFTLPCCEHC